MLQLVGQQGTLCKRNRHRHAVVAHVWRASEARQTGQAGGPDPQGYEVCTAILDVLEVARVHL